MRIPGQTFMNDLASALRLRYQTLGPQREPVSLLTGAETLEEMRKLILFLCQECPIKQDHPHCPFRIMSVLSHASRTRLVNEMPRDSCESLFELELHCRSQGEIACRPSGNPSAKKTDPPPQA